MSTTAAQKENQHQILASQTCATQEQVKQYIPYLIVAGLLLLTFSLTAVFLIHDIYVSKTSTDLALTHIQQNNSPLLQQFIGK